MKELKLVGNKYGNYKMSQTFIYKYRASISNNIEIGLKTKALSELTGEYWMNLCLDDICMEIDGVMCKEEWKDILYFEYATHKISSFGRGKSLVRHGNRIERILKPNKIRSSNDDPNNYYLLFHLTYKSQNIYKLGHVLVAEHFIANPEKKPQINHKSGIKRRNHVSNLEWNTQQENMLHSYRELNRKPAIGASHGLSKLDGDVIIEIRNMYSDGSITQKEIANIYNVSKGTIQSVLSCKTWKHIV